MRKAEVRAEYRARRQQLSTAQWAAWNEQLTQELLALLSRYPIRYLHLFWGVTAQKEPDTEAMIKAIRERFPTLHIVVPRVLSGTKELAHYLITPSTEWTVNAWGIAEPLPASTEEVVPTQLDLVIIPLLAFDEQGYRVGYGGGFYDRFLAKCRPDVLKVGLSFWPPIASITDVNPYDVRLDYCLTPRKVWQWPED
jgi:5-formyltetrahydrofolate cyclo-ligase